MITLAYFRGLTHSELANQTNTPIGTVKTQIRRGLAQLRMCVET
ncbi:MAG: sigma factor-like helix-turn-helix DNA-binding protein [Candidatus Thiodiazotropha sp.]